MLRILNKAIPMPNGAHSTRNADLAYRPTAIGDSDELRTGAPAAMNAITLHHNRFRSRRAHQNSRASNTNS